MATTQDALAQLAEGFGGQLLKEDDAGYDEARAVYNGMIDGRPGLIAHCAGTADVISAVRFAREQRMPIAVRCGGHSVSGFSAGEPGAVVIDLSPMKGVRVDPERRTARAHGGVQWGELDRETQAFGLATPGGRVTTTGVGGFTLGGGYGWLSTQHGLACDNLISADVVTADGRLLTASEDENEDLFWALRGGGGNFGVVTSFEFRLHPVGPLVLGGLLAYPRDAAEAVMEAFRELIDGAPDELSAAAVSTTAPPADFVPAEFHGAQVLVIVPAYCGDPAEGEDLIRPLRDLGPALDLAGPVPYRGLQAMLDPLVPPGMRNYWRGEHIGEVTPEAARTLAGFDTEGLHPLTALILFQQGGAVSRVPDDETPFANRDAVLMFHPYAMWEDAADDEKHIAWVREISEAMAPYKTGGLYLNFETAQDRVRAGFGDEKYARLAEIKREYDPDNVFRFNQNIQP